jgi:hypothetical protein
MNAASEEFHWCNGEDEIIIHEQRAIAVYPNPWGAVVIRAERSWNEEGDAVISIDKFHARTVAEAILAAADFEAENETVTPRPRRDRTNAERQRRYRNAHRYGRESETHNGDELPLLATEAVE